MQTAKVIPFPTPKKLSPAEYFRANREIYVAALISFLQNNPHYLSESTSIIHRINGGPS